MKRHVTPVHPLRNLLLIAGLLLSVYLLLSLTVRPARAQLNHCGPITADETWAGDGTVHTLSCNVQVPYGYTLMIKAGAIIKTDGYYFLTVDGALRILATEDDPATFTSIHDDTVGGDTNGNGAATTPGDGDWGGITFRDNSADGNSLVDYAVVRYAAWGITLYRSSLPILNSTFHSNQTALYADTASYPTLWNLIFDDNWYNGFVINGSIGPVTGAAV